MLEIENLSILIQEKNEAHRVVNNLNLSIEQGKCLSLVGESGSGKSMTAMAIMQLLPLAASVSTQSKIRFSNQDLLELSEHQMRHYRGRKIAMIFQDASSAFNPVMTIKQQMLESLRHQKQFTARGRKDFALNLLDKVGIKETNRCYQAYPHELSGGMRQRAMIAMALCGKPELIIADEPTTALDVTIQTQVIDLLLSLREKEQLSMLFITHHLAIASNIADEIAVMQQGSLVEYNETNAFFQQPKHAYSQKLLNAVSTLQAEKNTSFTDSSPLIDIQNLKNYFYGKRKLNFRREKVKAVDDVSFSISDAKTLALIGESGSGKTTIAKTIARLYSPTSGSVIFHPTHFERGDVQMIFQDPYGSLNPRRMIADSIIEGMSAQKILKNKAERLEEVDQLLTRVGLSPARKWHYPHEFSGGERQRICIARALALRPQLLILDEPTSALDASIQIQVLKLLRELQEHYRIAYLLITHDFSVVSYLAHEIAVMYQGKIVEKGNCQDLLKQPKQHYTQTLIAATPKIRESQ